MTRNPYSSAEIGPLMRDVKNKICHQLDLIGLLEDDYGMELLVAGNIISLDLSISQVYEQVWRKHHGQTQHSLSNASQLSAAASSVRDCPPMTVTYRLQVSYEDYTSISVPSIHLHIGSLDNFNIILVVSNAGPWLQTNYYSLYLCLLGIIDHSFLQHILCISHFSR